MIDKKTTQLKWIDKVFENIERLESKIIYGIENSSFDGPALDKLRSDLQQHYGALNNLKKSFKDKTYFVGYID